MNKKILSMVAVLCLVTALSGCTTYDNFKNAWLKSGEADKADTINIGVYEPLSGQYKQIGKEEKMGIELAHEQVPKVLGKEIKLIYGDNKSNIYDAEPAIQELMTNSPSVILGSYGETLSLIASDYLKAAAIPGITPSSTNPLITGNNDYYFTAAFSETKQGDALAEYAFVQMNRDAVATVRTENDDRAQAIIKRFSSKLKKLSGNANAIVGSYTLAVDTTDYSTAIEAIRNSGAKAVFLSLTPKEAKEFLKQCINNNFTHVLFLGSKDWNDADFLSFVEESKKLHVAYVAEQTTDELSDEGKAFSEAFSKKYGENVMPTVNAAAAYDAYMMSVQAIENAYRKVMEESLEDALKEAGTEAAAMAIKKEYKTIRETGIPSGRLIKEALSSINNYQGASGIINYGGNNEPTKSILIGSIIKGEKNNPYIALLNKESLEKSEENKS